MEMRMRHPAFAMLADDIAQMFDEAGAVNYLEYTVYSEKYGPMRVCIQRLEGETPAMMNEKLRKRIAELVKERTCKWTLDDGSWFTACGDYAHDETEADQRRVLLWQWCPYCGGKIERVRT